MKRCKKIILSLEKNLLLILLKALEFYTEVWHYFS